MPYIMRKDDKQAGTWLHVALGEESGLVTLEAHGGLTKEKWCIILFECMTMLADDDNVDLTNDVQTILSSVGGYNNGRNP